MDQPSKYPRRVVRRVIHGERVLERSTWALDRSLIVRGERQDVDPLYCHGSSCPRAANASAFFVEPADCKPHGGGVPPPSFGLLPDSCRGTACYTVHTRVACTNRGARNRRSSENGRISFAGLQNICLQQLLSRANHNSWGSADPLSLCS